MVATTWGVNFVPRTATSPTMSSDPARLPTVQGSFLALRHVPEDIRIIGDWKLSSSLAVEIRIEDNCFIARVPFLDEYGLGPTSEAALDDLLTSLVDYAQSLERREYRLSEPLKRDLESLRKILKKQ
jgi:hypothetical protein